MSKFRQIISVFLTFCLLLSLFPAQVIAVDETPAVPQAVTDVTETDVVATGHVSTGVQYNPLYDVPSVSGSSQKYYSGTGTVSVEDADYLTSAQEAAAVLRAGMVQRTADIPVHYRVGAAQCDGSEAAVIAIANEIFELALTHTGISTEGDALRWVYESFSADISYSATGEYYYFGFTFHMAYYTTAEQEAALTAQVDQVLSGFAFDENTDDYTKIKTIYDYICDNVVYDYDNLNDASHKLKFTAYAALMNGTSVCQGYALLLYRMLLDVGVDCRVITGIGGGDHHAWNIIAVGDAYYNADSTWDAGVAQYGYFLTCDANFPDHTRDDSYTTETFHAAYPMGAADYDPDAEAGGAPDSGQNIEITEANFPDEVFRAYTSSNIDVNGDGVLSSSETASVYRLTLSAMNISSLKGIEYFGNLQSLYCNQNNLTELDVSKNVELLYLHCNSNQLTSLDIAKNTKLRVLYCQWNQLAELDTSNNPELYTIGISCNNLTSLDVTKNPELTNLHFESNRVKEIDLSQNPNLRILDCQSNLLTSLDVQNNINLIQIICQNNDLKTLDVSKNVNLTSLWCSDTGLTTLDVSSNILLDTLLCGYNMLSSLDLSNNPAITDLRASGNVVSISADNGTYALDSLPGFDASRARNWSGAEYDASANCLTNIDALFVYYEYDCGNGLTLPVLLQTFDGDLRISDYFPDTNFREYVQDNFDVNHDGYFSTEELLSVENLYIEDKGISDLSGIEYFARLTNLRAGWNSISNIKISSHSLFNLHLQHNLITSLDLGVQPDLSWLDITDNPIESLDLSSYTALTHFWAENCSELKSVILPDSITALQTQTFYGCSHLTSVVIPNGVASIGTEAFKFSALTHINIPAGVSEIGENAFKGCSSLLEVVFEGNVPAITENSFADVTTTCYYPFGNATWTDEAKQDYGGKLTWQPYCSSGCSYEVHEVIAPTCCTKGYTVFVCSICGGGHIDNQTEATGEHIYDDGVITTAPTCIDDGVKTYTCTTPGCGHTKTEAVDPIDEHEYENGFCIVCGQGDIYPNICGDNLTCSLTRDGTLTISGTGAMYDYGNIDTPWADRRAIIQSVVIEEGVTSIGNYAFYDCPSITSISVPSTVTSIGSYAFQDCIVLTSIILPEGFTSIGEYAFYRSSLTSISLPEGITSIGKYAFYECPSLTSITLPEGLTSIGEYAFCYCDALTSIPLPECLTSIGQAAFSDCSSLAAITFNGNAPTINADAFRYVTATVYYPAGNDTWTDNVMRNYGGALTWKACCLDHVAVTDPAVAPTCTETGLTEGSHCSVCGEILVAQEVVDALGHTEVIDSAVAPTCTETGLTEGSHCDVCGEVLVAQEEIPANGHSYSEPKFYWAFMSGRWICEAFRTCDIDGHRDSALSWATATVKTPATCIEMGWTTYTATFDVDWMTTQTRDEQDIALTDHTYDDGVVTTESTCADEGVKTFTCSICGSIKTETVEATGEHEYENGFCIVCGEEEIYTGTCGNNLTWVLTQDGTLTVSGTGEMYSYSNGSAPWYSHRVSIQTVVIEEGVTSIGDGAFHYCTRLTSVKIPESVTSIHNYAFYGCPSLTAVELPDTLISIGHWAFFDCSALTEITIPEGVTFIGTEAFYNCSSLTAVELPDTLTSIGDYAFRNCSSLTAVELPDTLTSIDSGMFYNCSALTAVELPDTLTSIGDYAFYNCSSLTAVELPEGVTSIGRDAFSHCSSLTAVELPDTLTSIGESAFQRCSSLTAVVIPNGIISINDGAFSACSSLTSITFNGDAPTINSTSFSNVTATVYYPAGNDTWNESTMLNYGGTLTWKARCLDHVAVTDPAVAPTCTETGLTEGSHCSVCGEVLVEQEVVDALGHTWTSAAAVQPGFEQKVCTGCAGVMRIPLSGWVHLDGTWYHCTQPGVVDTGWHFVDGQLHYFSTNGAAATGWQQIDGARYYFDSLGALVAPDPRYAGATQFYPDDSGEMVPGWKQLDDTWYCFNESGCMVPGWREIRGTLYYYTDSGAWMPCWKEIGGTWYYYSRSDTAEPCWQIIGGFWDCPLSSGVNS